MKVHDWALRLSVALALSLYIGPIVSVAPESLTSGFGVMPSKEALQTQYVYERLPISFEANYGQTDTQVKFLSRGSGYAFFLTPTEVVLVLKKLGVHPDYGAYNPAVAGKARVSAGSVLRMRFAGANPAPQMVGTEELPGRSHYFIGNDPTKWLRNIPTYARVQYQHIYPGIDLAYYGNKRQLEYDFIVAPGADPGQIAVEFHGVDRLELAANGDLLLHTAAGTLRQPKPLVFQEVHGIRRNIPSRYVLRGKEQLSFQVASYDVSSALIIDPRLVYSTYLGSMGEDVAFGIAVDGSGSVYVTGRAGAPNFPTTAGAFDTSFDGINFDVFVTKLNPSGSALIYSTYLSGTHGGDDHGFGLAVDASGNAYVTGATVSENFPTTPGAFDETYGGSGDAFVTKLNPTGSALVYSTYLGANGSDQGFAIAVDGSGSVYVTGMTVVSILDNFPTTPGAFDTTIAGFDAFVTKLNPAGSALVYSTYLGGSGPDQNETTPAGFPPGGIAVDASGNAYVTGMTESPDFPTTPGAFDTSFNGFRDVFVTKLNPSGTDLVYSTFLGGVAGDVGAGIAVDVSGNAYVTGYTGSADFPVTAGAFDTSIDGGDAFITKLNPAGVTLIYSTYLGGGGGDGGEGIAIDASGNVYVTGVTDSPDFPTTLPAFDRSFNGIADAFVTRLNTSGTHLLYSSYLGGVEIDWGVSIVADASLNAYVAGATVSSDFPTTARAFDRSFNGGFRDAFVAKFATGPR